MTKRSSDDATNAGEPDVGRFENLDRICDAICAPTGDRFLRLMSDVYHWEHGSGLPSDASDPVAKDLVDLRLLRRQEDRLTLTRNGSLVGNVAKEYCHWLEHDRRMPAPRPPEQLIAGKDVLDLGCGVGRWLWEFQPIAKSVLGVERQREYLALGKALAQREGIPAPEIRLGSTEELGQHVPASSVDFVFSRLVFNYVAIRKSLLGVAATLRPRGVLWLHVEPLRNAVRKLVRYKRLRSKAYEGFGVCNALVCVLSGAQIRIRAPGRQQTVHQPAYPPVFWWKRAMKSAGLTNVCVQHVGDGPLVLTGEKP